MITAPPLTEIVVLSVRQPHAGAFFLPESDERRKWVENRSWTRKEMPSRLYIHSSSWDKKPPQGKGYSEATHTLWSDPPGPQTIGAIIGSVELVDVVPIQHLEALAETPPDAKEMPRAAWKLLYPSEREWFLERYAAVRPILAKITPEQFDLHASGSLCWIVRNPQLLATPIPTGGKLQLWKHHVPAEALKVG